MIASGHIAHVDPSGVAVSRHEQAIYRSTMPCDYMAYKSTKHTVEPMPGGHVLGRNAEKSQVENVIYNPFDNL